MSGACVAIRSLAHDDVSSHIFSLPKFLSTCGLDMSRDGGGEVA